MTFSEYNLRTQDLGQLESKIEDAIKIKVILINIYWKNTK